jgi:dihydroxyacetone kinase-like protein
MKKLINRVEDVLNEQLQGLAKAHPQLTLHQDPLYVTRTDAPVAGKVACSPAAAADMSRCTAAISARACFLGACRGNLHLADAGQNVRMRDAN